MRCLQSCVRLALEPGEDSRERIEQSLALPSRCSPIRRGKVCDEQAAEHLHCLKRPSHSVRHQMIVLVVIELLMLMM